MTDVFQKFRTLSLEESPVLNPKNDTWMITFADLMALLLAFFVLIFSMSEFDAKRWDNVVTALSSDLPPLAVGNDGARAPEAGFAERASTDVDVRANYLRTLFATKFESEIDAGAISTSVHYDRLLIELPSTQAASNTTINDDLISALAVFFETLREPIDLILPRPAAVDRSENAARTKALVHGEQLLLRLQHAGYGRSMSVYEKNSVSSRGGNDDHPAVTFSIWAGRR